MEPQLQRTILSIRLPLSPDPIFVDIEDMNEPLETVMTKTVAALEESEDKALAQQLAQLLVDHNTFSMKGARIDSTNNVGTLLYEPHILEDQTVQLAEITLLREHRGGTRF